MARGAVHGLGVRTLNTVLKNLAEGGALVILVLFVTLGSIRAGVVVALAIPLSMLFAANLMSVRPIQKADLTGSRAIWHSITHFWGHTQEIISMTRTILGDGYRYAGRSATSH